MDLRLVPAAETDSDFVYEVHRGALREYIEQVWGEWNEEAQRQFHEDGFRPEEGWFLIERDGDRVGVVQYRADDEELWLGRITVAPAHQGRGVGTAVIERLRRDHEGKPFRLTVLEVNVRGRRLYERLGFRTVRVDPPRVYMELVPRS